MTDTGTRNLARDSLFVMSELKVADGSDVFRVKVRNLSEGGLMAEGDASVQRGDKVTIELRNVGEVSGVVAWLQGKRFGIAFAEPIDPKHVRSPVGEGGPSAPRYTRTILPEEPDKSRFRKI